MMLSLRLALVGATLASLGTAAPHSTVAQDPAPAVDLRQRFGPLYKAPKFDLAWSADGSRALYLGASTGSDAPTVRSIDLATGISEDLVPAGSGGAYERIAFRESSALLWTPASTTVDVLPSDGGPATTRPLAETPEFLIVSVQPRIAAVATDFVLFNVGAEPVELAWVRGTGDSVPYATVPPDGMHRQSSYATHRWELTRAGKHVGDFFVPDRTAAAIVDDNGLITGPRPGSRAIRGPSSPDARVVRRIDDALTLEIYDASGASSFSPVVLKGLTLQGDFSTESSPDWLHSLIVQRLLPPGREVHYVESSPRDELQPVLHSYSYRKPGDPLPTVTLGLADHDELIARPISSELFPEPFALNRFRWAPDGTAVTFRYNERGHQLYRIVRVDAATGEVTTLVEERSPTFIDYPQKIDLRWLDQRGEFLWMSERSGWNHLELRADATGELVRPLTSGEFVVRGIERLDEAAGQVWLRVSGLREDEDPYHVHLARVDLDTAEFTLLTEGDGTHRFEFSPDGGAFVDTYSRVDLAPVTELRDARTGALLAELTRGSTQALEAAGWRAPLRFSAPGRDGATPIWGIVHLPTHYDPARSYPIIESIYAGPHGAHVPKEFAVVAKPNELAELGFIVVQIDGMGTNHRGKAFHDVAWQNLADAGLPDRRAWIEAAAAEVPGLDLTRVGIYGGSAGGQNALGALLDHGDFYDVAVSDCGCHDNRVDKMWWNELWMGWPIGPHYDAQSNVTRAHQLTGKLLLIVGEMDENVDPASTMQVVDALVRANKDFDLLVMPGVGHGAAETPYGTRRRRDFFVRHLLETEPR